MFRFNDNTKQISDIYKLLNNDSLIIDHSYQRRAIWTEKDKIRLIETILLHYVIPSVYWWQSDIDIESGEEIIHIVDGQQRILAIKDYIDGKFTLSKDALLNKRTSEKYHNKYFKDLNDEDKKNIWNYKISIIEIDKDADESDVIDMFRRLNLTEYTLNSQERRHAEKGKFHEFAMELSENEFWDRINIFTGNDVKRMKDVVYVSTIIILMKRGIVDQSKIDKPINEVYNRYHEEYLEIDEDKIKIENAINNFEKLITFLNRDELKFINKKVQNYTIFSIIFYSMKYSKELDMKFINRLKNFINLYQFYKNDTLIDEVYEEFLVLDEIKKYKLASSEGVNKLTNRLIRFNVLKKLLIEDIHHLDDNNIVENIKNRLIIKSEG